MTWQRQEKEHWSKTLTTTTNTSSASADAKSSLKALQCAPNSSQETISLVTEVVVLGWPWSRRRRKRWSSRWRGTWEIKFSRIIRPSSSCRVALLLRRASSWTNWRRICLRTRGSRRRWNKWRSGLTRTLQSVTSWTCRLQSPPKEVKHPYWHTRSTAWRSTTWASRQMMSIASTAVSTSTRSAGSTCLRM